jgi:hypothetical protein
MLAVLEGGHVNRAPSYLQRAETHVENQHRKRPAVSIGPWPAAVF